MSAEALCGWKPNPVEQEKFGQKVGQLQKVGASIMGAPDDHNPAHLWLPLLKQHKAATGSEYVRGSQKTGDCCAWGLEGAGSTSLAIAAEIDPNIKYVPDLSTISLYGLMRVEVANQGRPDHGGPGCYGAAAAQAARDYGFLRMQDYSLTTGNKDHDLRKYSGEMADYYGKWGNGGPNDKGELDKIARLKPAKSVAQVTTLHEAVASIKNGYPITVASLASFGDMKRDQHGVCRILCKCQNIGRCKKHWPHQMFFNGCRFINGKWQLRCGQSWGQCATGEDPGVDPRVSHFSWWVNAEDSSYMLQSGDCWAIGNLANFVVQKLDFLSAGASFL